MNFHSLRIALIAGTLALPAHSIPAAQKYPADHIKVYEPGTIAPDGYRVVKRLWTETWRSAFALPSFPDVAAAIEAMKQEAAKIGADAVTNVICLPDSTRRPRAEGVYCHGLLIKMN